MTRVTTNSTVRNYNLNLGNALSERNYLATQVQTHKKFAHSYEMPSAANAALRLHRLYLNNQADLETIKNTRSHMDEAEGALDSIRESAETILKDASLSAVNGTNSTLSVRQTYAATLREAANSMVQFANASYSGKYLFGGQHTGEAPFKIENDKLTYLGLPVDGGTDPVDIVIDGITKEEPPGSGTIVGMDGSQITVDDALAKLADEHVRIDIGLDISSGNYTDANTFDTSMPGIEYLGFGTTDIPREGNPAPPPYKLSNNIIQLTMDMAKKLENTSDEDWKDGGQEEFEAMMKQYEKEFDSVVDKKAALGVKSNYLETMEDRLTTLDTSYNTQIQNTEYVNDAEAITEYMYAQYAYNACLRVGNSILSNSLLDFLK